MERKKTSKQINLLIDTNRKFNEFIESLMKNYPLHTQDEENALQLQEHLTNLSVIFVAMQSNVDKKI